jgi:hypothetical protein
MTAENHGGNPQAEDRGYPTSPLFMDEAAKKNSKKIRRTAGQKILLFFSIGIAVVIGFVFMAANSERMIRERETSEKGRKPIMSDPSLLQSDLLAAAEALKYRPEEQPETPPPPQQNQIVVVRPPTERKVVAPAMLTDEEREAARKYRDMRTNALMSRSKIEGFEEADEENNGQRQNSLSSAQLLSALGGSDAAGAGNTAALMQGTTPDVNAYQHKLNFSTQNGAERTPQG